MPRHGCFLLVSRFPSFLFMNSGTFWKKTRTLKHWQKPCIQIFFKLFQKTCSEDLYSASLKLVYHEKTHVLKRFDFGWSSYHQFIIKNHKNSGKKLSSQQPSLQIVLLLKGYNHSNTKCFCFAAQQSQQASAFSLNLWFLK